jgi:trans-aconitate methyltransferase
MGNVIVSKGWLASEIVDVGCGNGLFAAVLHHEFCHEAPFLGIDFSEGSIAQASVGNGKHGHPHAIFKVADATNPGPHLEKIRHPLLVCSEVLEHLRDGDDVKLIESIPSGTRCLITVPEFDAPAHVRHFPSWSAVEEAYGAYFEDIDHWGMHRGDRPPGRGCQMFIGRKV